VGEQWRKQLKYQFLEETAQVTSVDWQTITPGRDASMVGAILYGCPLNGIGELPRLPMAPDFWLFSKAGDKLADLHLNYEQQPPYPLKVIENPNAPSSLRVGKNAPIQRQNPIDLQRLYHLRRPSKRSV